MPDPNDAVSSDQLVDAAAQQGATPQANMLAQATALTQPQQRQGPPQPGRPILFDLISGLKNPPRQTGAGGVTGPGSRLDVFENFLGNFLNALGQGMANQGHGPGSFGRGFGAAVTAPYRQSVQNYQLQQQGQQSQAEIAKTQAETQEAQSRAGLYGKQAGQVGQVATINTPYGPVSLPISQVGQYLRGGMAAQVNAASRLDVEKMKMMFATGQVSRVMPVTDEQSGKPIMRAFNKFGQPLGDIDGGIPPSSYLPKSTSTVEYKQLDDGSIVALPKTTTSAPVLPGGKASTGKGGSSPSGVSVNNGVVQLGGQPVVGKGAVTSTTRTMVETAPKVADLVDKLKGQVQDLAQSGALGPGASRWNDFWSGKVGTPNPKFRAMQTNATLLSTLLMRMHMGARGSTQIMQHFDELLASGKQSPENMLATLDQIGSYASDVKGAAPLPPSFGKSNGVLPQGNGQQINPVIAKQFLDAAGGDKDKARKNAQSAGWKF